MINTTTQGNAIAVQRTIFQIKTERILQRIIEATSLLFSYIDRDLHYQYISPAYEKLFQQPLKNIQGRHIREIIGETAFNITEKYLQRALAGEVVTFEEELSYQGREPRYMHIQFIPDINAGGKVGGLFIIAIDLTGANKLSMLA